MDFSEKTLFQKTPFSEPEFSYAKYPLKLRSLKVPIFKHQGLKPLKTHFWGSWGLRSISLIGLVLNKSELKKANFVRVISYGYLAWTFPNFGEIPRKSSGKKSGELRAFSSVMTLIGNGEVRV